MMPETMEEVSVGIDATETTSAKQPDATLNVEMLTAMRLAKVQEHLRESLGKADALEANLGAVSSDLMLMACRLKEAIEDALGKKSLDHFDKLVPAIDAYLRVARQIDRLANLDRRLTAVHGTVAPSKPR